MSEPLPGSFADVKPSVREVGPAGCLAERGAGRPSSLPCLNSHNSIHHLSSSHRRTVFALTENVRLLAHKYGLERLGFLTLTFKEHITCTKEAQKRFNSLRTNLLCERYEASITVLERMKSARIHYHLLVVLPEDIRTGFDFEAVGNNDYRSANAYLRAEWAAWRGRDGFALRYGFGRTELLPIKSTSDGIAKYVGKYISKHLGARRSDDKGARLVRYTVSARAVSTNFAWFSPSSKKWRARVGELGAAVGATEITGISKRLGPRWAYHLSDDFKVRDESRWRDLLLSMVLQHGGELPRKPFLTVGCQVLAYSLSASDLLLPQADGKTCLDLIEVDAWDMIHALNVKPLRRVLSLEELERSVCGGHVREVQSVLCV